jgi:hypothetical protein
MKKSVKSLVVVTSFLLVSFSTVAQLKLPVISGVAADVKKVIEDYPHRFIHLMGEVIAENPQSTDYQCNFKVNGAEESFITRYSAKKEVCSWEALMLTTEDFNKAKQKFKNLFNQLNNLSVDIGGIKNFHLRGQYEAPVEENKFTAVLFSIDPAADKSAKLKVEIIMQYQAPMDWKIKVLIYDREREDDERGKLKEE